MRKLSAVTPIQSNGNNKDRSGVDESSHIEITGSNRFVTEPPAAESVNVPRQVRIRAFESDLLPFEPSAEEE